MKKMDDVDDGGAGRVPEVHVMFLFRFNLMRRSKPKDFLLTSAPASASWQWSSSTGD